VRAVDGVCIVFAAWTLCCHAVMALGGSLRWLLGAFAMALVALLALCLARRGGRQPEPPPAAASPAWRGRLPWIVQGAGLLLGVVGVLLLRDNLLALWWWTVLLLGGAFAVFVLGEQPRRETAARGRGLELGLWALALGCAAVALVSHRLDMDDAFYINLAVAAADAPRAALFSGDTLHGIDGLPLQLQVYRLHSYEIWNGALSLLSGIPAIVCFHWISAAVAALLVPLCFARLLRQLTPRHWLWTVAAVVWVLVAAGGAHRWYGNFAFVRMWQGKSIFLFVFLPLVYAYALEFALRPTLRRWLLLAAAQIAALGCTSSAVWAAPAGALVAACAALRPTRRDLLRLALVGLASLYVLGVGWSLKQAMALDREAKEWSLKQAIAIEREAGATLRAVEMEGAQARREAIRALRHQPGLQLEWALNLVTGDSPLRAASLLALLAAWACCGPGLARRFAIAVPLGVTLVVLNPYATLWLSQNLTGPSYWRSLWALPVPLLMALILVAPLQLAPRWRHLGRGAALAALALFAVTLPGTSALSESNGVELGWPRLKVQPEAYRWARVLTERSERGSTVAAPVEISVWLGTFHDRVYPLLVRPMYLDRYREELGLDDLRHRILMTNFVAGESEHPDAARLFAQGLRRFDVRAVCLRDFAGAGRARAIMRAAGFELDLKSLEYEIWLRS
jgi:hypothetical protein